MTTSSKSSKIRGRNTKMAHAMQPSEKVWRFHAVRIVLFVAVLVIAGRLIQIQIVDRRKYIDRAIKQYTESLVVKAPRGAIYDRHGTALAMNEPCYDVGIDKYFAKDLRTVSRKLAKVLNQRETDIFNKIRRGDNFVLLARQLPQEKASVIEMMNLPGVKTIQTTKRMYPLNEKLAQVIGFVGVDGRGLSGVELALDDYLSGKDGWSLLQKDALGKPIMPINTRIEEQESGNDVILTIDHVFQTIAEEELRRAVEESHAKGGNVIIMEPTTGEILAMASLPGFDANKATKCDPETWRIRPITDIFEPGSTFKIVTMMAALKEGFDSQNDIVFCENGKYELYGEEINDSKEYGWLSFRNVFINSSNIGTAKIARKIGKEKMFSASRAFGFGNKTGIGVPGEVNGILRKPSEWSGFSLAAISYGHEVAVTPLQVALAYAAIANGGLLMKPIMVDEIKNKGGETLLKSEPQVTRRVMDSETAARIAQILSDVVEKGTGQAAQIPNVDIAGKTGTAQKPLENGSGYSDTKFVASFAGFYPVENARLLIYVTLDEPMPAHSGGDVAAPAFRNILQQILEIDKELDYEPVTPELKRAFAESKQVIPDLTNRSLKTALGILNSYGIRPTIQGQGQFVRTQEIQTSEGDEQPEIILTLGDYPTNAQYVSVPSLSELSLREAVSLLSAKGLKAKIEGCGRVVKQEPEPGSQIKVGARCYLICEPVSKRVLEERI